MCDIHVSLVLTRILFGELDVLFLNQKNQGSRMFGTVYMSVLVIVKVLLEPGGCVHGPEMTILPRFLYVLTSE